MLESRYEQTGEKHDLIAASDSLYAAWNCLAAVPFYPVNAAARCLKLLGAQQFKSATQFGQDAIKLLSTIQTNLLDRKYKQFAMSKFTGIATNLCAFLLELGQPQDAIRLLEQGREVIIG